MHAGLVESNYGSDPVGLVSGFRFRAGQPGAEIDSAAAVAWLKEAGAVPQAAEQGAATGDEAAQDFVWLHFNLSHSACERWLRTTLGLPEAFFEALRQGSSSTRIERLESTLLAVVNDVIYNFGVVSTDISTLWACADRRLLVTARARPLRSVDRLRASVRAGERFRSPLDALVHLFRDQADVLVQIVRETSANVDKIEDQLLSQRLQGNRSALGAMRRGLVRLQRLLAPEPGALFRLLNRPPEWAREDDLLELRASTEEFSLVLNDLAALVERIKLLQEEIAAALNEQTNRTLFTLTLVTVLALPINIVAGFFGMNVGGIPLGDHPHGFWILVVLVATFTVLAGRWAFRRSAG
ncbi:magnesium transporter CorA [Cupriavidus sp. USMAA2-4]|uniref:Magnesium transporter CorA n=1 Tax=Cupriavidus malaysiensis TaxID=367825 RepID=A0ABN4TDJ8_9BURK|nr:MULTISPECIES: transporter [Cupriavidus]AOY91612.1 magnesium transporter CorA [Cupriavidus sp. USMAA2-4]AOY98838.1 magnesium transporter CorA [Cupriavidus sp. USMAHM13]AOZ05263.1 magnesium transporter CorA [Cupriavidus malaysiensis]